MIMSMPVQPSPCETNKYSLVKLVQNRERSGYPVELVEHDFVECALSAYLVLHELRLAVDRPPTEVCSRGVELCFV